jgi:hypothetical protein
LEIQLFSISRISRIGSGPIIHRRTGTGSEPGCGSCLSGDAADGGTVDAKDAGDLGAAASRREHVKYFSSLLWHKHRAPPAEATLLAGRFETGAGPLPHHGAFEFCGMRCTAYR